VPRAIGRSAATHQSRLRGSLRRDCAAASDFDSQYRGSPAMEGGFLFPSLRVSRQRLARPIPATEDCVRSRQSCWWSCIAHTHRSELPASSSQAERRLLIHSSGEKFELHLTLVAELAPNRTR